MNHNKYTVLPVDLTVEQFRQFWLPISDVENPCEQLKNIISFNLIKKRQYKAGGVLEKIADNLNKKVSYASINVSVDDIDEDTVISELSHLIESDDKNKCLLSECLSALRSIHVEITGKLVNIKINMYYADDKSLDIVWCVTQILNGILSGDVGAIDGCGYEIEVCEISSKRELKDIIDKIKEA